MVLKKIVAKTVAILIYFLVAIYSSHLYAQQVFLALSQVFLDSIACVRGHQKITHVVE